MGGLSGGGGGLIIGCIFNVFNNKWQFTVSYMVRMKKKLQNQGAGLQNQTKNLTNMKYAIWSVGHSSI